MKNMTCFPLYIQYISMVTLCIGQQIKEVGVTAQTRATLSGCKLP